MKRLPVHLARISSGVSFSPSAAVSTPLCSKVRRTLADCRWDHGLTCVHRPGWVDRFTGRGGLGSPERVGSRLLAPFARQVGPRLFSALLDDLIDEHSGSLSESLMASVPCHKQRSVVPRLGHLYHAYDKKDPGTSAV